jgi:hypothetical protein
MNEFKQKEIADHAAEAEAAFEKAIETGRLSVDYAASNYAGRYMYMGTGDGGRALFKNSVTRRYDV